MRVFVDATASSTGGLGTYTREMLRAWGAEFRADQLRVCVAPRYSFFDGYVPENVELIRLIAGPNQPIRRLLQQNLILGRMAAGWQASVFLSLLPQLPLSLATPAVAVVHDLWHEVRPADFSAFRRLERSIIYGYAYHKASALVTVSERTRSDLLDRHPDLRDKTRTVLAGCDHVIAWSPSSRLPDRYILAFGHHSNKRPDLALESWLELRSTQPDPPALVICGLDAGQVATLQRRASLAGAGHELRLHGYVAENDFRSLLSGASALLFPSVFEGFGLPVLEAMRFGIPTVVSPDPGLLEVAGGRAEVAPDWESSAISAALSRALSWDDARRAAARLHAEPFTWTKTARGIRTLVQAVANESRPA